MICNAVVVRSLPNGGVWPEGYIPPALYLPGLERRVRRPGIRLGEQIPGLRAQQPLATVAMPHESLASNSNVVALVEACRGSARDVIQTAQLLEQFRLAVRKRPRPELHVLAQELATRQRTGGSPEQLIAMAVKAAIERRVVPAGLALIALCSALSLREIDHE